MAYDSETYGQSPFGTPSKPGGNGSQPGKSAVPAQSGPDQRADQPGPADSFPAVPAATPAAAPSAPKPTSPAPKAASTPVNAPPNTPSTGADKASSKRKSRTSRKPAARKSKAKAASAAQLSDTATPEVASRFDEEDRRAYLSLLYKTGISGLVWAVLRLSRYEISDQAIAIVNIILHPLVMAAVALLAIVGLTFWLRYLLKDFAQHTQQLHTDAETPDAQNYRPTLEIVGDALEYNPKLRKNFAALFNAASILVCSLVSYLVTSAVLP
ncbi:MAG: hypothetical protein ACR2FS_10220 [Phormidesmis sp.]